MPAAPDADFAQLVAPLRAELRAHCYRMLGSVQDADDALQDALLAAWRGLGGFEARSSLRSWLYRIATNACFQLIARRPKRALPAEQRAAAAPDAELEPVVAGSLFIEPYPEDPQASYEQRESVELAFVAALQHLPPAQRATLLVRDVLGYSATEAAELLETSSAAVESALQRARTSVERRVPSQSQQATLRALGAAGERELVARYIAAWQSSNVSALLELLAPDAKFSMPPIPSWFHGRDDIGRFFERRIFATAWELRPLRASGQLAFACYQGPSFHVGALNVVSLSGTSIREMVGFLDPAVYAKFLLPER